MVGLPLTRTVNEPNTYEIPTSLFVKSKTQALALAEYRVGYPKDNNAVAAVERKTRKEHKHTSSSVQQ